MASSTEQVNSTNELDFGANDWLIDDMREQFQKDPDSVGPAWARFFRTETSSQPVASAHTNHSESAGTGTAPVQHGADQAPHDGSGTTEPAPSAKPPSPHLSHCQQEEGQHHECRRIVTHLSHS